MIICIFFYVKPGSKPDFVNVETHRIKLLNFILNLLLLNPGWILPYHPVDPVITSGDTTSSFSKVLAQIPLYTQERSRRRVAA